MRVDSQPFFASSTLVPEYVLDRDDPASLFTRLQRVVIHIELLRVEAMRGLDVTFRDFVILATLRKEPAPHELPVSRIAEYVLRPMGSISQAVDRVEKLGYVVRKTASDDRRKVIIALTPAGEALADRALATYNSIRERVFGRMTSDELDRLDDAVTTLVAALDADYEEVPR